MARKGRKRWTTRIVVEDCLSFDIANLMSEGVFRAKRGTLCSSVWRNQEEQEIFRAYFWVELNASGKTLLHVSYGVPSSRPLMQYAQNEIVEIVQTPLYFGPSGGFCALASTITIHARGASAFCIFHQAHAVSVAENAIT
jgi:hypothetical protein